MRIAVTGANGFVGQRVVGDLTAAGHAVLALVRDPARGGGLGAAEVARLPQLCKTTDVPELSAVLAGCDAVVHLAARVHAMDGGNETEFFDINVDGSVRLLEAAVHAGVKRFVFISSVKAAGERSGEAPLRTDMMPMPEDAYGRSKLAAERALTAGADAAATSLIILRPTFVYGWPLVGNFKRVVSAVTKGVPLPLGGIRNRRHMIYVGNLSSAIHAACVQHMLRGVYYISDGEPVSSPDLFRMTATAFASRARLFYVPPGLLTLAGAMTGRRDMIQRLIENLEVDDGPFRRDAAWRPSYNMTEGLAECAAAWRNATRTGTGKT